VQKSINANIEAELMLKAQKAHEGKPFLALGKVSKYIEMLLTVLRIRIRDPVLFYPKDLVSGSGMIFFPDPGS
jgi:hypothetical protein